MPFYLLYFSLSLGTIGSFRVKQPQEQASDSWLSQNPTPSRLRMRNGPQQLTAPIDRLDAVSSSASITSESGNDWALVSSTHSVSWGFLWGMASWPYRREKDVLIYAAWA